MADVFISYSRIDQAFVKRLDEALKKREREAWVDWTGIRPTEEFMQAIYSAIEAADTFIFVLSPDSVASVVCGKEIAHAAAQNKRMIPLVAREVCATAVPEALAKLNWIFCRESDAFDAATDTLIIALDTDLDWVRTHTRLLTRAVEWEAKGKNNSFVLRGDDLRAAEQWLTEAGTDKERQPTALQTAYIIASRKAAARRQRITLGAVTTGLVVAIVLAVIAVFARQRAEKATEAAQSALTRSFARTIGSADDRGPLRPDERAALWELAELDRANEVVRKQVIDYWFGSEDALQRALRGEAQGLHAAIGLNAAIRKQFTLRAREWSARLNDPKNTPSDRTLDLGMALARQMDSKETRALGALGAQTLIRRLEVLENGFYYGSGLTLKLADLAPRIDPEEAASCFGYLTTRLEDVGETGPDRLLGLGHALAVLASRIEPKAAMPLATRLVVRLEDSKETDSERLRTLNDTLAALAPRIAGADAAPLAKRLATRLRQEIDSYRLSILGDALAALLQRIDAKLAGPLASPSAQRLAERLQDPNDVFNLSNLGKALTALSRHIEPNEVAPLS